MDISITKMDWIVLDLEKIDVWLISETHFTKELFTSFDSYGIYYAIHPDNVATGAT